MKTISKLIAWAFVIGLPIASPAYAAVTTFVYQFSASGFPAVAPVDPVFGQFSVTFDPAAGDFSNEDVVTDFSINIAVDGGILASLLGNTLRIGGNNDADGLSNNTNDFFLFVHGPDWQNPNANFEYCIVSGCNLGPFDANSVQISAVPLPAAAWLMLGGLGALFGFRRR